VYGTASLVQAQGPLGWPEKGRRSPHNSEGRATFNVHERAGSRSLQSATRFSGYDEAENEGADAERNDFGGFDRPQPMVCLNSAGDRTCEEHIGCDRNDAGQAAANSRQWCDPSLGRSIRDARECAANDRHRDNAQAAREIQRGVVTRQRDCDRKDRCGDEAAARTDEKENERRAVHRMPDEGRIAPSPLL